MATRNSAEMAAFLDRPPTYADAALVEGEARIAQGTFEVDPTTVAGDVIRLIRLPAKAKIVELDLASDAQGTAFVVDIGIYDINGVQKSDNFFADALNIGPAAIPFTDYRFGGDAPGGGADINTIGQELWQHAGYGGAESVPGGLLDITLLMAAVVGISPGTISYRIKYVIV